MAELFETRRSELLNKYKDAGQRFIASTKPYKSTLQLVFEVTNALTATGDVAGANVAHAVARKGQELEFFAYKIGDSIPQGTSSTKKANESDTNLSKPRQTNGTEDFVIEAVSASVKGMRVSYALPGTTAIFTGAGAGVTDPVVQGAYTGVEYIHDPGAIIAPPQVQSPYTLEDAFFQAVCPKISVGFEWDRKRIEKVGTLDEFPEGAASSFLRAHGDPRTDNRYKIPEGYIWRREGEPDSEFAVKCRLEENVVIPINLVALFADTPAMATQRDTPLAIFLDITMRLHGLSAGLPSRN